MSMVSVCLPSDALLQHLPSYLGFSYLEHGVSLHSCSSKAQPLLLTLDEGFLFTAVLPDLQRGIAPLGPPVPAQPPLLRLLLLAATPDLQCGVSPPSHHSSGCSSQLKWLKLKDRQYQVDRFVEKMKPSYTAGGDVK